MISIEQPPSTTESALRAYLMRMFKVVGIAIDAAWILQPTDRDLGSKDGTLTYFGAAVPSIGVKTPGLYFNVKGVWKRVQLLDP